MDGTAPGKMSTALGKSTVKQRGFSVISVCVWSVAFGLAYTQAPLFSSNQNQYFLHGLARAGFGFLNLDWLSNTVDPTPVFSLLVQATFRALPLVAFYAWALLLFGIYLYSLEGIASSVFDLRADPIEHRVFLALFVVVHAALFRFLLFKTLGDPWSYTFEAGLAGQRLLGPVLEPSMFGVLLLLSVHLASLGRYPQSVLASVLAATFHPTYLLSAGLLIFAYMIVQWSEGARRQALMTAGLALLLVLPILVYTALQFATPSAASLRQAQEILVRTRIPHHALIEVWWNSSVVVQVLIVAAGIAIAGKTRIFIVMASLAGAVAVLTLAQAITGSMALALIFPWRPSTLLVPMGTTLLLGYGVEAAWRSRKTGASIAGPVRDLMSRGSITLTLLLVIAGTVKFRIDLQQVASSSAQPVLEFVDRSKHKGEIYMIPPQLQDFRLATGAPALVDFKSIPYRAKEVIEWYDRLLLARAFYREEPDEVSCRALRDSVTRYGVTHVILESAQFGASCGPWLERYRDGYFAVFEVGVE